MPFLKNTTGSHLILKAGYLTFLKDEVREVSEEILKDVHVLEAMASKFLSFHTTHPGTPEAAPAIQVESLASDTMFDSAEVKPEDLAAALGKAEPAATVTTVTAEEAAPATAEPVVTVDGDTTAETAGPAGGETTKATRKGKSST